MTCLNFEKDFIGTNGGAFENNKVQIVSSGSLRENVGYFSNNSTLKYAALNNAYSNMDKITISLWFKSNNIYSNVSLYRYKYIYKCVCMCVCIN